MVISKSLACNLSLARQQACGMSVVELSKWDYYWDYYINCVLQNAGKARDLSRQTSQLLRNLATRSSQPTMLSMGSILSYSLHYLEITGSKNSSQAHRRNHTLLLDTGFCLNSLQNWPSPSQNSAQWNSTALTDIQVPNRRGARTMPTVNHRSSQKKWHKYYIICLNCYQNDINNFNNLQHTNLAKFILCMAIATGTTQNIINKLTMKYVFTYTMLNNIFQKSFKSDVIIWCSSYLK
ncbi:Hypothetical_protein [Hexamita inflata]|uniref:Hypothetical_protein n=1 Tax=Hexamita inflata TaxID=28002 RepID=A0AA86NQ41_9EUKA|nr:Hypothetical protein HINF_LOCUS10295 [Hexamita inflata]